MIKENEVEIKGHSSNYKYYHSLGYSVVVRMPFFVKTIHLMKGSITKITSICDNCFGESKNTFKDYHNYTNGLKEPYYCNKCNFLKSEVTCLEKYGVTNPMKSDDIKSILKESLIEKYGVDHFSKTDEYKLKVKKTNLKNHGVDNVFKSDDIKNKIKKSNLEKYGNEILTKTNHFKEESKKTNLKKYGNESFSKTDMFIEKLNKTSSDKYGKEFYSKTDEFKDKIRETISKRDFELTEMFKLKTKNTKERKTHKKYSELISEHYDTISYKDDIFKLMHKKCNNEFELTKGLLYSRFKLNKCICVICNPIGLQSSGLELEIRNFLTDNNVEYEIKNKSILNGKELDIYIPSSNIAIEVNGVYWHSELFKNSKYHLHKTNLCNDNGINLMHIWEDDWNTKQDIIKSIILNRLGKITNKIFSRNCIIKEVKANEYKEFLNKNHIQGYASSSINLGMYYKETLVSLMTFGYRRTNNSKEFELIRFCNSLNYSVIGSANKLFKYFLRNYKYDTIISYADISLFTGNIYKNLGFIKDGISDPNYFWVVDGIRKHRYNYSKRKLVSKGYDSNLTEVEIMHSLGYYRIYSTGQVRWVFTQI